MEGPGRLADAAARKAADRAEALTLKGRWRRFCRGVGNGMTAAGRAIGGAFAATGRGLARSSRFVWRNMPRSIKATAYFIGFCIALGFLSVSTAWELNNAGKGWALIFAAWGVFAWWAGVAVAGWCMWAHRQSQENYRAAHALKEKDKKESDILFSRARKWFLQTILCALVTLFGVFSNLVSHASMDADRAIEVEQDREAQRQIIRRLDREYAALPKPVGVEADKEALAGYEAEAAGWKMKDLDPETTCRADLRPRQRELCNLAIKVRADIKDSAEAQVVLDAKQAEIDAAEKKLAALQPLEGAKQYQRMQEMVDKFPGAENVTASEIQTWGVFLICVIGLFVCMWGWDSVGEAYDNRHRQKATP